MPTAVKFDRYGGIEVLRVVEVEQPVPGPGQVRPPFSGRFSSRQWFESPLQAVKTISRRGPPSGKADPTERWRGAPFSRLSRSSLSATAASASSARNTFAASCPRRTHLARGDWSDSRLG